jgi:two-component system, NtrC family, response regulator HydG
MNAYLVVREGTKWRDVYRLTPGQAMTVGRAPTNRIVLNDEVCSRHHCEVFPVGDDWFVRDLKSRNGTLLNEEPIERDQQLAPGQIIRIGSCELAYTLDLSQAFPQLEEGSRPEIETGTVWDAASRNRKTNEPTIIHRKGENRFARAKPEQVGRDRTSRELAQLYRLALDMGSATTAKQLAEVVLGGLTSGPNADVAAIFMLPKPLEPDEPPGALALLASKTPPRMSYQPVSDSLSLGVLRSREAVLARDSGDDSGLVGLSPAGGATIDPALMAHDVICAPIRHGTRLYGLVHLYSSVEDRALEPEDLEFALAIAEQYAVVIDGLRRRDTLADGLVRARNENTLLREQLEIESELVGDSEPMRRLKNRIGLIGPTDATVLIRGESGVGKELVARAIHLNSRRKSGPFVCMNCAALSESLLESELFGHEKGSFTGAVGRKLGRFEQAHKGTLMLDEVGEMSLAIQAKFLRVLEGHPFERVGGGAPVQVDVRVVAATNRDLEKAVESGEFRKDLYFRLQVVELTIEPLRMRKDDLPALANFFLEKFVRKTGRPLRGYTPDAMEKLCGYDWPGNVRELQNTIERAVILSQGELVEPADLQLSQLGIAEAQRAERAAGLPHLMLCSLEELEQQHILQILEHTQWNKTHAAQILGIERSTLDRKLKRYQVGRPGERGDDL